MSARHWWYVVNDLEGRFTHLKGPSLDLLKTLAMCASDRGNVCWPSERFLVKATHQSRATIYRAKSALRDLIEIEPPGYKRSNCYYFPPVTKFGKRVTDVAKVLEAKREQEREAKGEIAPTIEGEETTVDNLQGVINKSLTVRQGSQIETVDKAFSGLTVRRQPSQIETGGGLKLRPEYKDEYKKKSVGLLPSQIETSHRETSVDNYDGRRVPTKDSDYEWIRRQCRAAGMDDEHVKEFFSRHRQWGWNHLKPGVNVCDLIADFVTEWRTKYPRDWATTQDYINNGVL